MEHLFHKILFELLIAVCGGVLSGLICAPIVCGFTFIFLLFWNKSLLPGIENILYPGIRIEGIWRIVDQIEEGESIFTQDETLEIKQSASKLSGSMILVPKSGDNRRAKTLKLKGTIKDGFIILSCTTSADNTIGYQTFLGNIAGNGDVIRGQASYYHTESNTFTSLSVEYRREGFI